MDHLQHYSLWSHSHCPRLTTRWRLCCLVSAPPRTDWSPRPGRARGGRRAKHGHGAQPRHHRGHLPRSARHQPTLNTQHEGFITCPTPGLVFAFLGLSLCFGIKSLMLFKLVALKYYLKGKKGGYIFSRLKENIHSCSRQRTVPRAEDKIKSSGNRRIQTDLAA